MKICGNKVDEIQNIGAAENEEKTIQVTSRGSLENKVIIPIKNYKLTVNSDLRTLSNLSADEFNKMLSDTKLNGLGKSLEQAERECGVNGLYLMGLACLESGYGTSNYAKERNNLVGWGAYDSNPNKAKYFKSKDECILYVAEKLKTNYLSENGTYFEGYTAKAIDIHYCSDKEHANKIIKIVNKLVNKL